MGTPGLWEVIVSKKTKIDKISQEDKDKYLDLINTTNAKFTTNKYGKEKIAAPNSSKYKIIQQLEAEKAEASFSQAIQMPCVNVWNC